MKQFVTRVHTLFSMNTRYFPEIVFRYLKSPLCIQGASELTHCGRVTHICVGKPSPHCFRYWAVAWMAPSHDLNQCLNTVNWTTKNTFQNVVCEMASISSQSQCVRCLAIAINAEGQALHICSSSWLVFQYQGTLSCCMYYQIRVLQKMCAHNLSRQKTTTTTTKQKKNYLTPMVRIPALT